MADKTSTVLVLGGAAVGAYFFWPKIQELISGSAPASVPGGTDSQPQHSYPPAAPPGAQLTTGNTPIGPNTPGAVAIGNGCFQYNNLTSCPPGVSPPTPAPPQDHCAPGYNVDANGVCTLYSDTALLNGLNSLRWTGLQDIPAEQIARIDPQILTQYASTMGVNPGTVLAYMLGLGGSAPNTTQTTGSDGNLYIMTSGVWVRQLKDNGLSRLMGIPLARLNRIAAAVPVNNQLLMQASHDPETAAILADDPRARLTVPQWNYFYTQASGIVQSEPQHPAGQPGAKVNAEQYQALRAAAGLPIRLGMIRSAPKGAFPLGGISNGPARIPFVPPINRTIYRIPGRGAVPQHLGRIQSGGGNHRWERSPFPRPANWRNAE